MANALLAPMAIGLMGRRPQGQNPMLGLLGGVPPVQADQYDELMAARAPNGYVQQGPQFFPADAQGQMQGAMPQRDRVSGWRVLDRVLGGQTISGGIDAERARLTEEAMRPQQMALMQENENIARALGPQALLALRTNPQAIGEGLAAQYKPTTTAAGGISTVFGTGQQVSAPRDFAAGTGIYRADPLGGVSQVAEVGPTYTEQNAARRNEIDAIGAGQSNVGNYRVDANGNVIFAAPDQFTLSPGQTRYENGQQVASAPEGGSAGPSPESIANSISAIANTRRAVDDARKQVNWRTTGRLASLIPFNQAQEDLQATADTIEANLSFNALQQMRDASKTGGALGSIAVRELELLGSTIASLKTSQSPEQFMRSLDVIDASLNRWETALSGQQQPQGSGPIAVNRQTGARVQWNGSAWVPVS